MSDRILQINFKYNNVSPAEFEETVDPMARPISEVEGLIWKIMMHNECTSEAGGIYLFESTAAIDNYLSGPIVAQIISHPALSDFSVKQFGIMEGFTAITRGPVGDLAVA